MRRRSFLKAAPAVAVGGCISQPSTAGRAVSSPVPTDEPPRAVTAGTLDGFADLSRWSTMDGSAEVDTDLSPDGTQSVHLHASATEPRARIVRRFERPIDMSGLGVGLSARTRHNNIPYVQVYDAAGNRVNFRAPVRGGLSFQPFDFGVGSVEGSPDLSAVTEIRITVWAGEGESAEMWCDDLALVDRVDTGTVVVQFDDGNLTDYSAALPVLEEHGFVASTFVCPGSIGTEGKLGLSELSELREAGWDVASHTTDHEHLPTLDRATQEAQIAGSKDWLVDHGFERGAEYLVYPYGEYDQTTIDLAERYHELSFAGGFPGYGRPTNRQVVQRVPSPGVERAARAIDIAAAFDGITVLFYHQLTAESDPTRSAFESTMSYLAERASNGDVRVVPARALGWLAD